MKLFFIICLFISFYSIIHSLYTCTLCLSPINSSVFSFGHLHAVKCKCIKHSSHIYTYCWSHTRTVHSYVHTQLPAACWSSQSKWPSTKKKKIIYSDWKNICKFLLFFFFFVFFGHIERPSESVAWYRIQGKMKNISESFAIAFFFHMMFVRRLIVVKSRKGHQRNKKWTIFMAYKNSADNVVLPVNAGGILYCILLLS